MAENFQAPGVIIRELRAGVPQIRGVPTSIGGMVGRTLKGWANRKVRVSSFAQWVRIFGSYDPNSYVAESVDAFFKNGGNTLYFNRVLGSSGGGSANTKAARILSTAGAVAAMTVTTVGEGFVGNTQRVKVEAENTKLGKIVATAVPAAAAASVVLTASGVARVRIGDTLRFSDTVGPQTVRAVVKYINNNTVVFENAMTVAGAGLATATTDVYIETFALSYFEGTALTQGPFKFLRYSSLSQRDYFVNRINTDNDENQFTVSDSAAPVGASLDNRPVNTDATNGDLLTGGDEFSTFADAQYIGSTVGPTGLYVFDKVKDLRMLAIPGVTGATAGAVSKAVLDYCTARADCVAIVEPPLGTSVSAAVTFKNDNVGGSSYGAMYYPWVQIIDPLTSQPSYSPPSGYVMGMIARTDQLRGVQKAPAGEIVGRLSGVIGLERELTDDDRATLYPQNINPIQNIAGIGQSVMGSRTMENGEFNQISVRRTFIYLEQSIKEGTTFVLFEPNDAATRAKARRTISAFLTSEWRRGTLEGATLDEAFFVTCDESNNPFVIRNEGKMIIGVGVNVPKTTEFLIIEIQQDQRGAEAAVGV